MMGILTVSVIPGVGSLLTGYSGVVGSWMSSGIPDMKKAVELMDHWQGQAEAQLPLPKTLL